MKIYSKTVREFIQDVEAGSRDNGRVSDSGDARAN